MEVYAVSITRHADDYKCRDGWSTTQTPKLFSTIEKAKQYLAKFLLNEIQQSEMESELSDYYDDDGELIDSTPEAIINMCDELFVGEYVPSTLDYSIEKCRVDE
jgi:hypothetical protein